MGGVGFALRVLPAILKEYTPQVTEELVQISMLA